MKYILLIVGALFVSASTVNAAQELLPAPPVVEVVTEQSTSTPPRASFEYTPVAPTADALQDTTVTPSEFNISRTLILPGSRLYGVKQTIRRAVLALTWRQKSRTEKKLIYANRMLVEAWELAKKGKDLQPYGKARNAILKTLDESFESVPLELPKGRFIRRALRVQIILDDIASHLPSDLKDSLNSLSQAQASVSSASIEEITAAVEVLSGSTFRHFRAIELLHELGRSDVQDALLVKLKIVLETSPIQTREQFDDYVLGLPGNPVRHFMIMDALRSTQEFAPDFVTQLDITKGKLAVKIVKIYDTLPGLENPLVREQFVIPLFDGSYAASRVGAQLSGYVSDNLLKQNTEAAMNIILKALEGNALSAALEPAIKDPDVVDLLLLERFGQLLGRTQELDRAASTMAVRIGKEGYGFSGRFADPALLDGVEVLKRLRARYPSLYGSFTRAIEVQEAKEAEFRAALTDE